MKLPTPVAPIRFGVIEDRNYIANATRNSSMSKKQKPESLMMSYGYKPDLSEGAIKPPIFQTSTFTFKTAEEGKAFFEVAYGLREQSEGEEQGLIYSRINNRDLEILEKRPYLAVDNTYLGPIWQHPLKHGADLVIYSATKYIGGHSDVIAGACLGSKELIKRVKGLRTFLGNMAGPWTGWLLMRGLETLKARMDLQAINAERVAEMLNNHAKVGYVYYLGNITEQKDPDQYRIREEQCLSNGAMLAFDIEGGEPAAFRFLNALRLIKLAVSLGSTESLAEHPATMTHADVDESVKANLNITASMLRISVGVENWQDLCDDIEQALAKA